MRDQGGELIRINAMKLFTEKTQAGHVKAGHVKAGHVKSCHSCGKVSDFAS